MWLKPKSAALLAAAALVGGLAASSAVAGVTYTYDVLGRLTLAAHDSGLTIFYNYDAAGNRTSTVVIGVKVVVLPLGLRRPTDQLAPAIAGGRFS